MILTRPGTNTMQEIIDTANIKELLEFERFCRDNALWDEMKKCFSTDSTVNISWFQGSGEGFVDASSKMTTRAPHKIYNTEIWLNGDKAVAIMMTTIQMRIEMDGCLVEIQSDAKLLFRTQKINGLWYIVSFDTIYEKDALIPVYPSDKINLPVDELSQYRQSYACMIYCMNKNGNIVNQDLAGIDRPDLVEKIYSELDEWLCK